MKRQRRVQHMQAQQIRLYDCDFFERNSHQAAFKLTAQRLNRAAPALPQDMTPPSTPSWVEHLAIKLTPEPFSDHSSAWSAPGVRLLPPTPPITSTISSPVAVVHVAVMDALIAVAVTLW